MARKILVLNFLGFAEIFTFSTPAPMVSGLANIAGFCNVIINIRYCANMHDVI